jgi:predicted acetyltransferase
VEPEPIAPGAAEAFVLALQTAFHADPRPDDLADWSRVVEPERSLAIRDGGRMVATAGSFTRRLVVPGGEVPLAAVTLVGVRPTHRRRGLLTALMRRQLASVREPVAALWASESAIYGRFGYGLAALAADLEVRTPAARLRRALDLRPELATPDEARAGMVAAYEAARRARPGMLDRDERWWDDRTRDREHARDGAGPLRAAVIDGRGYALYAVRSHFGAGGPDGEVRVRELLAADPEAHAALWAYLLELDLTRRVAYGLAPADEPLLHMVTEAQAVQHRLHEALWVRLVDVPAALTARTYAAPFRAVLELADDFCPRNAGRWALAWDGATATCERAADEPDLALAAADLGAAYLGGTTLAELAWAGRVLERRPGTLAPVSRAFRGDRAPWCPEIF